jgi:imidazolonepropionase-like amidohydrolase
VADGVEGVRKAVRERFRAGSDFIKIFATGDVYSRGTGPDIRRFTLEEIKTIVDEAHAVSKKVAAHAEGTAGIKNAANGGVDTIEHGVYLDDEACQLMKRNNVILVPTLAVMRNIVAEGIEAGMLPEAVSKGQEAAKAHQASVSKAHEAGVKIAMGSDTFMGVFSHGQNARELQALVEAGLTPMEAIVASTKTGAETLGLQGQIGTLEPGKIADIIIVDGDPLQDIRILQDPKKIRLVMKAGEIAVLRDS